MGRASAAQGGEYDQEHQARDTQQAADTMGDAVTSRFTVKMRRKQRPRSGRGLELSLESDMPVTSSNVKSSQHYIKASRYVRNLHHT